MVEPPIFESHFCRSKINAAFQLRIGNGVVKFWITEGIFSRKDIGKIGVRVWLKFKKCSCHKKIPFPAGGGRVLTATY